MAFTIGGAAGAPWLIDSLASGAAALLSVVIGGLLSLGFRRAGWLGSGRIVRASWAADGRWALTLASGGAFEHSLDERTRVARRVLWLCWREDGPGFRRRAMLLSSLDLPPDDYRRLAARLRLDAQAAARKRAAPVVVGA